MDFKDKMRASDYSNVPWFKESLREKVCSGIDSSGTAKLKLLSDEMMDLVAAAGDPSEIVFDKNGGYKDSPD